MAEPQNRKPTALSLKLLGWCLGGLSVLNLIRDLTPLELYGSLRKWIDAYAALVETLARWLFGWIHWRWIEIDGPESHVLLLAVIVGTSATRAKLSTEVAKGQPVDRSDLLILPLAFTLIFLIVLLLAAPPYGTIIGVLLVLFYALIWGSLGDKNVQPTHFRSELIAVLATFLIVVLLNYFLFLPLSR